MEPFEGLDFYDIESLLTEEEIMVRDMVREWVDEAVSLKSRKPVKTECSTMNGVLLWVKWGSSGLRSKATDARDCLMSPTV